MLESKRHKTSQTDAVDLRIAELSLSRPDLTDSEIGKIVGLSRGAVVRRKQRDGYEVIFLDMQVQAQNNILNLFTKATSVLCELLDDSDSRIRLMAAAQILKLMPKEKNEKSAVTEAQVFKLDWRDEIK